LPRYTSGRGGERCTAVSVRRARKKHRDPGPVKSPFTHEQLKILNDEIQRLGFDVLLAPGQSPESPLLASMIASKDIDTLNKLASSALLDLTVSTDNRPFFFQPARFSRIPQV